MELKDINLDYILTYCKKKKDVDWLKELILTPGLTNKNGKDRKVSFIEIRNAFVNRYEEFRSIRPQAKPKKPSMYELIMDL